MEQAKRFYELDSLRGIAALTVFIFHGINLAAPAAARNSYLVDLLFKHSPLKIFSAGHQAVMLFFLLSGFVLALPFLKSNTQFSYTTFLVKRVCRIYLPYLFAVSCGLLMRAAFSKGSIQGLWGTPVDWGSIRDHLLFLVMLDQNAFDPVVWSLVHEMRISLLFPLVMYFVLRFNWKYVLGVGLLLSLLGIELHCAFSQSVDIFTNYFDTLHYLLMFLAGALLAANRQVLTDKIRLMSRLDKLILLVLGFILYSYPNELMNSFAGKTLLKNLLADWIVSAGAVIWILIALSTTTASNLLLKRPFIWMGKISYSFYLFHILFFLTWISVLPNGMSKVWIWIAAFLCSLLVSTASFYLIEKPSIALSHCLTQKKTYFGSMARHPQPPINRYRSL